MPQSEYDSQRTYDIARIRTLDSVIKQLRDEINTLNGSLHFKMLERSNIEYRLRETHEHFWED